MIVFMIKSKFDQLKDLNEKEQSDHLIGKILQRTEESLCDNIEGNLRQLTQYIKVASKTPNLMNTSNLKHDQQILEQAKKICDKK